MPKKPQPCPQCGKLRNVAGNAPADRVCFDCYKADPNKGRWKDKPAPQPEGEGSCALSTSEITVLGLAPG